MKLGRSLALMFVTACSASSDTIRTRAPQSALPPDSAVNPIIVRVTDAVPDADVRHLNEEVRIAPGVNDVSTFTRIHEFIVDNTGSFWVYDDAANTIFVFDSGGKFVRKVGQKGSGPGEFKFDGGMVALADGRVAVWDDGNSRISFFAHDGKYATSWTVPRGAVRFQALGQDASGQLTLKRTSFTDNGNNKEPTEHETLIRVRSAQATDTLRVPDLRIPRVEYALGSEGDGDTQMYAVTFAKYAPKMLWAWHPAGFFVTGHGARYEITLFRTKDRPIRIERASTPVAVMPGERREEERQILGGATRSWKGAPLPETKPALMDLYVAPDGRIWARVPMPSVATVIFNPDKRPGKPLKVTSYLTPAVWEVFSSEGKFLGRVAFPGRAKLMHAEGNRVWAIDLGEDDLPSLVRYHIERAW